MSFSLWVRNHAQPDKEWCYVYPHWPLHDQPLACWMMGACSSFLPLLSLTIILLPEMQFICEFLAHSVQIPLFPSSSFYIYWTSAECPLWFRVYLIQCALVAVPLPCSALNTILFHSSSLYMSSLLWAFPKTSAINNMSPLPSCHFYFHNNQTLVFLHDTSCIGCAWPCMIIIHPCTAYHTAQCMTHHWK